MIQNSENTAILFSYINLKLEFEGVLKQFHSKAKQKGLKLFSSIDNEIPDQVFVNQQNFILFLSHALTIAISSAEQGIIEFESILLFRDELKTRIKFSLSWVISDSIDFNVIYKNEIKQLKADTKILNGSFKIYSESNNKIEICCEIDFPFANQPEQTVTDTFIQPKDPAYNPLDGKRILVVEDNGPNQLLATNYLTKSNAFVDLAEDGLVAVEKAKKNQYDLIIMDLQMPNMDGFEATNIIRHELKLTIPIIACSAHSLKGEKANCIEKGMNDYISKPYERKHFLATISKWLELDKQIEDVPSVISVDEQKIASFSLENLNEMSGGDIHFEKEMISIFLKQSLEMLQTIADSFQSDQFDTIPMEAHKLKSSLGIIGANISHVGKLQYLIPSDENKQTFISELEKLKTELEGLNIELSNYINTL